MGGAQDGSMLGGGGPQKGQSSLAPRRFRRALDRHRSPDDDRGADAERDPLDKVHGAFAMGPAGMIEGGNPKAGDRPDRNRGIEQHHRVDAARYGEDCRFRERQLAQQGSADPFHQGVGHEPNIAPPPGTGTRIAGGLVFRTTTHRSGARFGNTWPVGHHLGWLRPRMLLRGVDLAEHVAGILPDAVVHHSGNLAAGPCNAAEGAGRRLTSRSPCGLAVYTDGDDSPSFFMVP